MKRIILNAGAVVAGIAALAALIIGLVLSTV